jgi:DNA-binding response OmpR family regulator
MSQMPTTARRPVRGRTLRPAVNALRALHALLADAEPAAQEGRVAELAAAGFRVSLARTAFEAIVKASCQVPDLIVLGGLPDMDATETSQLLSTCPVTSHIPIIQLTPGRRVPARALVQLRRAVG